MLENEINAEVNKYHWYHTIKLTGDITTPGWEVVIPTVNLICKCMTRVDFKDKSVLDVGCRDGLMSFEAERLGAREVIAIDNDLSPGATEFLIPFFHSSVKMLEMNLYDLRPETFGMFDVIIFPGVLYHLRYPFWGLKLLRDLLHPGGVMIVETAVRIENEEDAILYCPVGHESPYEPSSCTFFNRKGLVDTLRSLGLESIHVDTKDGTQPRQTPQKQPQPRGIEQLDRLVVTCRFNPEILDKQAIKYWDGMHDIHSAYFHPWEKNS